jgi:hypothetical protein
VRGAILMLRFSTKELSFLYMPMVTCKFSLRRYCNS